MKRAIVPLVVSCAVLVTAGVTAPEAAAAVQSPVSSTASSNDSLGEQTARYMDGTVIKAVLRQDGQTVDLYVNGRYSNTTSINVLRKMTKKLEQTAPYAYADRSRCGQILLGVAAVNAVLWYAASLTAVTGAEPVAAAAGVGGLVTDLIIGEGSALCTDR